MSIDIQKLKALAKAATPGPWVAGGNWVSTAKGGSVAGKGASIADCARGDQHFIAAANPAAVLELISRIKHMESEIDGLRHGWYTEDDTLCFWPEQLQEAREERDQLKAENEKLKVNLANEVIYGYAGAFYHMAEKLGIIGARPASPQRVFEDEVMPALLALIAERDRLAADNRALAEDPGSAL